MRGGRCRERQNPVNTRAKLPFRHPAVEIAAGGLLFFGRRIEHGESMQGAIIRVKRSYGKYGPSVAPSHQDHAAARCQQRDCSIEIRLTERFPPYIYTTWRKLLDPGVHHFGFVVERQIRSQFAASPDLLIVAAGG